MHESSTAFRFPDVVVVRRLILPLAFCFQHISYYADVDVEDVNFHVINMYMYIHKYMTIRWYMHKQEKPTCRHAKDSGLCSEAPGTATHRRGPEETETHEVQGAEVVLRFRVFGVGAGILG